MSQSTHEFLGHMRDEAEYILRATHGLTKTQFQSDETLKRAVTRSLEIIGEAAKNVPDDFRNHNPDIPWRAICAMRDRLIHGYITVNYNVVWDTVTAEVPRLLKSLHRILNQPS